MSQSGPPNIPPSELWARLATAERPFELVDFPRKDPVTGETLGKIAMWPLTESEYIIAKAEATRYARKAIQEKFDAVERVEGYAQVYEESAQTEILWRCCRRPENVILPAFPTAAALRDKLTGDECSVLIKEYALVKVRLGPIVFDMTDEVREAWIKRLREGGSQQLAFLTWEQQTALLMHLVSQHAPSPTDSGSAGSPPDEPMSSISE